MNHECPHCYVNLRRYGLKPRLVTVRQKKGLYPCCPFCHTVLDINLPPVASGLSVLVLVALVTLTSQSITWFESLGYVYENSVLFSFLVAIVVGFFLVRFLFRVLPAHWSLWRPLARAY